MSRPATNVTAAGFRAGRTGALQAALVALVAVLAFAAALQNEMIGDDHSLLIQRIRAESIGDLLAYVGENYWGPLHEGGLYRPLTLIALGAQKLVFGDELALYRCVNLALHAGAAVLVLRILARLFDARAAAAGALIFAAHPIHAEAVVTIYGQGDLWSAVFLLGAVERAISARASRANTAVACGLFFLSLSAKESGALLPLMLVSLAAFGSRSPGWPAASLRRTAIWASATLLVFIGLRMSVLGPLALPTGAAVAAKDAPFSGHLKLVVVTLGSYFKLTFWPCGQTVYHGHLRESVVGSPWVESAWLVAVPLVLLLIQRRIGRASVWLCIGWVAWSLAPVANIIPIGTIVAERCLYLPVFGLSVLFAGGVELSRRPPIALTITALAVLAGLSLSFRVTQRWSTSLSHWVGVTQDHPRSPKAFAAVGTIKLNELANQKHVRADDPRLDEIDGLFDTALELNPNSVEAIKGKGRLALRRRELKRALRLLERAEALRPNADTRRRIESVRTLMQSASTGQD